MSNHAHAGASPGPAALAALSTVCFAFFAILTGRVPHEAAPLLISLCIAGGIIQIIAGIIDLGHGDIVAGTTFFVFGGFFMFGTAITHTIEFVAELQKAHVSPALQGWEFLCLALILIALTPSFAVRNVLFFIGLLFADAAVLFIGLVYLGILGKAFLPISGWLILFLGLIGIYFIWGQVYNTAVGRMAIPLGGPIIKPRAPSHGESVKG